MNIKRIGRALICLLLIFCLILNIAPPKAEATGAGLAATLVGASSVSVAAPLAVGAGLIALGVMASEVNPLVFENVVNDAVDSLAAAGNWVKDGTVELLQTIDSAGQKAYYVAGEFLEYLRTSSYYQDLLKCSEIALTGITLSCGDIDFTLSRPVQYIRFSKKGSSTYSNDIIFYSSSPFSCSSVIRSTGSSSFHSSSWNGSYYFFSVSCGSTISPLYPLNDAFTIHASIPGNLLSSDSYLFDLAGNLTFGSIPYVGAFTDGSSA